MSLPNMGQINQRGKDMQNKRITLSGLFILTLALLVSVSGLIGGATNTVEASIEASTDVYCTIPASGPWPPCATGGGGGGGGGDCVIPASGPWPPCATGGGGGGGGSTPGNGGGGAGAPAFEPQPLPIRTGNLSYFAFDETGNSVFDSNTGSTGTISGNVNRIAGPRNTALNINNGGSVTIPDANNITIGSGDFSIAMWVRVSKQSGVQTILDRRTTQGALVGYHVFTLDGKLGIQLADGNGNVNKCKQDDAKPRCTNYITNKNIANGQWTFIAITVNRDSSRGMRFWVNDVVIDAMNPRDRQGSLDSSQNVPLVMRSSSGASIDVDEFYLYGKELSDDQVLFLFRNR